MATRFDALAPRSHVTTKPSHSQMIGNPVRRDTNDGLARRTEESFDESRFKDLFRQKKTTVEEDSAPPTEEYGADRFGALNRTNEQSANELPETIQEALQKKSYVMNGDWFAAYGSLYKRHDFFNSHGDITGTSWNLWELRGHMRKFAPAKIDPIKGCPKDFYSSLEKEIIAYINVQTRPRTLSVGEMNSLCEFLKGDRTSTSQNTIWRSIQFGMVTWSIGGTEQIAKHDSSTLEYVSFNDFSEFVRSEHCSFSVIITFKVLTDNAIENFVEKYGKNPPRPTVAEGIIKAKSLPDPRKKKFVENTHSRASNPLQTYVYQMFTDDDYRCEDESECLSSGSETYATQRKSDDDDW